MQTLQTLVEHFKLLSDNSSNNTKKIKINTDTHIHTYKLFAFAFGSLR